MGSKLTPRFGASPTGAAMMAASSFIGVPNRGRHRPELRHRASRADHEPGNSGSADTPIGGTNHAKHNVLPSTLTVTSYNHFATPDEPGSSCRSSRLCLTTVAPRVLTVKEMGTDANSQTSTASSQPDVKHLGCTVCDPTDAGFAELWRYDPKTCMARMQHT